MQSWQSKLQLLVKRDVFICLIIAVLWQLTMTIVGFAFDHDLDPLASLLSHVMHWDAGWYLSVISDWYASNLASAAFYPLYPLAVWTVSLFGIINIPAAVLLVNTICLFFALLALLRITHILIGGKLSYLPVLLLLAFPSAFFMHVFYTESLFIAIGLWAYLFALQKKWWQMGILLALITACRLPGLLIVALCGLEFYRAHAWNLKQAFKDKNVLTFLLAPIGFLFYGSYLFLTTGDGLGMLHAYQHTDDWGYQQFNINIFETIFRAGYQSIKAFLGMRPHDNDIIVNHLIPFVSLVLIAASSLYFLLVAKKKFIPIGFYGLLSIVLFTLNNNVVSVHRYALPVFGIYLFGALLWHKYKKTRPLILIATTLSFILQLVLYSRFIGDIFAG